MTSSWAFYKGNSVQLHYPYGTVLTRVNWCCNCSFDLIPSLVHPEVVLTKSSHQQDLSSNLVVALHKEQVNPIKEETGIRNLCPMHRYRHEVLHLMKLYTFKPRSRVVIQHRKTKCCRASWISRDLEPKFGPSFSKYMLMHSINLREIFPSSLNHNK